MRTTADAARAVAAAALGRDPGPLSLVDSASHHVCLGSDVVLKILDAEGHDRLDRETALAPHLPAGLTAPLLGSGTHRSRVGEVRYACYARVPGTAPGMGLPGVDAAAARSLAEHAVERLDALHQWRPAGRARDVLEEPLDHGGFVGQAALAAEIERLASLDRDGVVPGRLLDGLTAIAEHAPSVAAADVPVHADCHWGNWLACEGRVTALLDFEWARFGEPVDDWFFLARFSGPHRDAVLRVIAAATATPVDALRADCEVREASYLACDLCAALARPGRLSATGALRLRELEDLVVGHGWERAAQPG